MDIMKRTLEDIAYGEAIQKLEAAREQVDTAVRTIFNKTAVTFDPWDELWKRLCQLSSAVQEAECAYRRLKNKEEKGAMSKPKV